MMQNPTAAQRNRRRGLAVTLGLHLLVVAGFVYPWLVADAPAPDPYETVVAFDFTSSAAAASSPKRVRNATPRPVPERKAAPDNPAPPALPAKPAPPVLSAPTPLPPVPDLPEPTTPEPEPEPTLTPDPSPEPVVKEAPAELSGSPTSVADDAGTASAEGTADGAPDLGEGATVADAGAGPASIGSALEGDGVLVRRVIFRPRLDEVVQRNGSVVLNLCINPRGRVIGVKYNEERSTITDMDVVRTAIGKAQQYRFASDPSAAARECGTLSIHVKGL